MNILLTAARRADIGSDVSELNNFDQTFSDRYIKNSVWVQGEKHPDAHRYHLFFLNVEDEKVPDLVSAFKDKAWCRVIGKADDEYNMVEEPLFSRKTNVSADVKQRNWDFIPR